MTPVAGRIAYTDQHHFIERPGFFKGIIVPGVPFDRIMGML
jgi:hypothetical protein